MAELQCSQVDEIATEYALGILPPGEARAVSAHLLSCPACRREIEEIRGIGDQMLDLLPDAEPPLGFDQKVLSAVGPRARRPARIRMLLGAAAAALVLAGAGLSAALLPSSGSSPHRAELASVLRAGDHDVGSVYVGGHPTWVSMTVDDLSLSGPVSCQLVWSDGNVTTVGTFWLVHGSGSWGAPDPAGMAHLVGARLVGPAGELIARATF
jgi:hypothetical protein